MTSSSADRPGKQVNVRLSDPGVAILEALSKHWGITYTSLLEMMLREGGRALGIYADERGRVSRGPAMASHVFTPQKP
jgi:hypothetical protein